MADFEIIKVKQHQDGRGILYKMLTRSKIKNRQFGEIYLITAHPGVVRANHLHKHTTEWFFVVSGKALLRLKTPAGKTEDITMEQDRAVMISPGVAHAVKNIGSSDMIMIAYADREYDEKAPDTFRQEVLQ